MGTAGRSIEDLLDHIVIWDDRAHRFTQSSNRDDFLTDELLQAAVCKCIEAIGEACGSILRADPQFQNRYPALDVTEAYRARNRLAHGYDTINWSVVWDTATVYVPSLVEKVRALSSDMGREGNGDGAV